MEASSTAIHLKFDSKMNEIDQNVKSNYDQIKYTLKNVGNM